LSHYRVLGNGARFSIVLGGPCGIGCIRSARWQVCDYERAGTDMRGEGARRVIAASGTTVGMMAPELGEHVGKGQIKLAGPATADEMI
jgi:hypothetical protein